MLTRDQMREVIGWIVCEPYSVHLNRDSHGSLFLQISCELPDTETREITQHRGGKHLVSKHSTESEIVQKALSAILAFQEHEIREGFKYRGVALFNPHIDVRAHMEIADRQVFRDPEAGS